MEPKQFMILVTCKDDEFVPDIEVIMMTGGEPVGSQLATMVAGTLKAVQDLITRVGSQDSQFREVLKLQYNNSDPRDSVEGRYIAKEILLCPKCRGEIKNDACTVCRWEPGD